jgi:hypothetical protein
MATQKDLMSPVPADFQGWTTGRTAAVVLELIMGARPPRLKSPGSTGSPSPRSRPGSSGSWRAVGSSSGPHPLLSHVPEPSDEDMRGTRRYGLPKIRERDPGSSQTSTLQTVEVAVAHNSVMPTQ